MQTIYKYTLDGTTLEVPETAVLLDFGAQGRDIVAWYIVHNDPDERTRVDTFAIYGTGWEMTLDPYQEYFKTLQMPNGLVFHIFLQKVIP